MKYKLIFLIAMIPQLSYADATCTDRSQEYTATIQLFQNSLGGEYIGTKILKDGEPVITHIVRRDDIKMGKNAPFGWKVFEFSNGFRGRSNFAKSLFSFSLKDAEGNFVTRLNCEGTH